MDKRDTREEVENMNEQAAATRDIIKSAQLTASLTVQLHKAAEEQAVASNQISQFLNTFREASDSATTAINYQKQQGDIASDASGKIHQISSQLSNLLKDQNGSLASVLAHMRSLREQADQVGQMLREQSFNLTSMTHSANTLAQQVSRITSDQGNYLNDSTVILSNLNSIRQITEQHRAHVAQTQRATEQLLNRVQSLISIAHGNQGRNGKL